MYRVFLIAISFFVATTLLGSEEGQKNVDFERGLVSLEKRSYEEAKSHLEKAAAHMSIEEDGRSYIEVLFAQAKVFSHTYAFDEAINYYAKGSALAKKYGWIDMYLKGLDAQAGLSFFANDFETTTALSEEIIEKTTLASFPAYRSDAFTNLANIANKFDRMDQAIGCISEAIALDSVRQDSSSLPYNYSGMGNFLAKQGKNTEAIGLFYKGLEFLRPTKDDFKIPTFQLSIGQLFLRLNNLHKSEEYGLKAIANSKANGLKRSLSICYNHMAFVEIEKEQYNAAIQYADSARQIFEIRKQAEGIMTTYCIKSLAFLKLEAVDSARVCLEAAEKLLPEAIESGIRFRFLEASAGLALAERKNLLASGFIAELKEEVIFKNSPHAKLKVLDLEYLLAKQLGDSNKALEKFEAHSELEEALLMDERAYQIMELEGKYEQIQNEKKIEASVHQQNLDALAISQKDKLLKFALVALVLLALLGLFLWFQGRVIKQAKTRLEFQNLAVTKALKDKELLLKEIHHRVKNNLQVVSSLLSIQSRDITDAKALQAVNESRSRVKSMALIHQDLYQEDDLMGIDSRSYIDKLTKSLFQSYKSEVSSIQLITDVDDLKLDIDTGIPLGLIINELITNCMKYAFPEGREGTISVSLKHHHEALELFVADDGVGMDEQTITQNNSFGLKMIKAFAKKLDATWEVVSHEGTMIKLVIRNYKAIQPN